MVSEACGEAGWNVAGCGCAITLHLLSSSPCPLPDLTPECRFGIGIFYVLLYMLLKVAFDSEGWLVQIGNVVQLLYLFLIIVQVCGWVGACLWASRAGAGWPRRLVWLLQAREQKDGPVASLIHCSTP